MTDVDVTGGWTRRGLLGAASLGVAAPLVAAFPTGASAASVDTSPNGVAHRLAQLEYDQAIAVAKLKITERQALYGLLFNGDGLHGPDRAKWGDEIFTAESPFIAYDPNLQIPPLQTFPSREGLIAMEVAREPKIWPNTASANGSMHYMYNVVFDEITLTEAKTRTPAMIVSAVKGTRVVNNITLCVYHDEWTNTVDGWRKTSSTWYRLS
jgi:hypothetical protein